MMKKNLLLLTFIISVSSYSQTGINTSNPQSPFHVDGAKDNNLTGVPTTSQQENDVVVSSTGQIGVGTTTPSAKLHINSSSNPGIRIVDGTQGNGRVLTSDANGNGTWTPTNAIKPTAIATLPTGATTDLSDANWHYLSTSINLPPGKWLVQMGTAFQKSPSNSQQAWVIFGLSNSSTSFAHSADLMLAYTGSQIAGATSILIAQSFVSGVLAIDNSTTATKTYYLWGIVTTNATAATPVTVLSPFGAGSGERYFYAIPIN